MMFNYSNLKYISYNYPTFVNYNFNGPVLKEAISDIAKGSVGVVADHVMAPTRLLTTPFQVGRGVLKNIYQGERNKGNGPGKALLNTTLKPVTGIAKGVKNTISQGAKEVKGAVQDFKSAPIRTTKSMIQGAQDFKEEAEQNGVLSTVESKLHGLAQRGAQAATQKAINKGLEKVGQFVKDNGIDAKVIGQASKRFTDSYNSARTKGGQGIMNSFKAGMKGATRELNQKTNGGFDNIKSKVTEKLDTLKNSNAGKAVTEAKNKFMNAGKDFVKSNTGKELIDKVTNSEVTKKGVEIAKSLAPKTTEKVIGTLGKMLK